MEILAEIVPVIIWAALIILLISTALSLFWWKRLPVVFNYLTGYLIWNVFIEGAVSFLPAGANNLPLLHLYTLLEFVLFSLLYRKMGIFDRWGKNWFWFFVAAISLNIILNSIFLQSIYEFNSYAKTLVQVILIGYSVAFLFQLREKSPQQVPHNILNAAVLIGYSGSLFVFMTSNMLFDSDFSDFFWHINVFLNFIFQILVLVSIIKARKIASGFIF